VVVAVVWILRRLASAPLPLLEPPAPATSPER
jgi:hypothetical protein